MTFWYGAWSFQRFLSYDLGTGLYTCDLSIGLHRDEERRAEEVQRQGVVWTKAEAQGCRGQREEKL